MASKPVLSIRQRFLKASELACVPAISCARANEIIRAELCADVPWQDEQHIGDATFDEMVYLVQLKELSPGYVGLHDVLILLSWMAD